MNKPGQQLDIIRHAPKSMAQAFRIAAETSRKQYPHDERRAEYYDREADRLEREAEATQDPKK